VGLFLFEGYHGPALVLYHMDLKYALVEAPFFFVGGLLWLLEQRFDALYRADLCLAFLTSNYMVSSWLSWGGIPLAWFTVPYMAVTFGRLSLPVLNRAGRFGDLSYGLYLYAFPIQQVILARWPDMPHPVLVCAVVTCPAAFMSWHLVERPALHMQWPRRSSAAQSGGPPQSE
jgi:peptidoglycan/LPS O-acetylase OafA/YrhL